MARVLIVDDERLVRTLVREVGSGLGHEVLEADSLADGLRVAEQGVDLVLLDVMLPDGDGLARVERFRTLPQKPEVLVITGFGHADGAAFALRAGALDYLAKPLHLRAIEQAVSQALAWREQRRSRTAGLICPEIVGKSRPLLDALGRLAEAAASDVSLLILGETGAGKELFARALHRNSRRRDAPCVTVDCAALSTTLLEAQLFGHAKGAFTGADRGREGLLKSADTGTVFLDEVGELPLDVQGTFLRALDVRRFRPVGEKHEVSSDFRVVAATNKNLEDMARIGTFRSDLLFRLEGMAIEVPPLRRRREDIPLLTEYFLDKDARTRGTERKSADAGLLEALMEYNWPGNIRELAHTLQGACAAAGDHAVLRTHHLPASLRIALTQKRFSPLISTGEDQLAPVRPPAATWTANPPAELPTLKRCREDAEAAYLDALMRRCRGDMPRAARMAGVSRGHLYELLRKHDKTPAVYEA